mgnify:CR=1 FL=1
MSRITDLFKSVFCATPEYASSAPGRVEILGNHTDYNDGLVISSALSCGTLFAGKPRSDSVVRVFSNEFNQTTEFSLDHIGAPTGHWSDYLKGVAQAFQDRNISLSGLDAVLNSSVPTASGLSSSASLEVGFAMLMQAGSDVTIPPLDIARLCRNAENNYVGMSCGILDQYSSVFGKAGHLIKLDCRSLSHEYIPFDSSAYTLVISNTGVKHNLVESEYNTRHNECMDAAEILNKQLDKHIAALRDVSPEELETQKKNLPDKLYRRAKHITGENHRVERLADCLKKNRIQDMPGIFRASHESSRVNFENSCNELDILVDLAYSNTAILGARLTGGGFGGCTLSIVPSENAAEFTDYITRGYKEKTGKTIQTHEFHVADGAASWSIHD